MRIRDLLIDPPLVLAPMEGVTDVTFRRLVRRIGGVSLTCTEFIPARGLVERPDRCKELADFDPDEHPLVIQLFGRDPELLAEGARVAEGLGADVVDLNMGCPSKKVCAHSGGSALMKEPELVQRIVRTVRAAVQGPLTVKMRAGWDPEHQNAPELAWMCQEEGAEAVTVHWRTRAELYGGTLRYEVVAEVKRRLTVPVLFNGDVIDAESARAALGATGCDGLMVGRGAIRDPWVFRRIAHALYGGPPVVVDAAEQERVLLGYYDDILERFGSEKGALGRWKKITRYFGEGLEGGEILRDRVLHSRTVDEARDEVRAFFAGMAA
ncbi:MAG: tRNA dihydrouridine synthase DusB [Alphaproteobacteria bacterium]|nr:tRNA dihydrouridine synthase DusB [Alphaproteobacteria bacterium]